MCFVPAHVASCGYCKVAVWPFFETTACMQLDLTSLTGYGEVQGDRDYTCMWDQPRGHMVHLLV